MFQSLEEIIKRTEESGLPFWKIVQEDDCRESNITAEESFERMKGMYRAMVESVQSYDAKLRSASGLVGTEGAKVHEYRKEGRLLAGDFIGTIMERALMVAESNACMKRIVAAPTAGSCGVVPAVLTSVQEVRKFSEEQMAEALYVVAGIGGVIAERASLAGAEGGCQAEIGSASAMAAGGLAYLMGGDAETIAHASVLALKGLLGLACDPVAGLVEVPCVKRNVIGAVNAVTSADMALAGVISRIPPDQVIDAMRSIGRNMPADVRETGRGGLAATPEGIEISRRIQM